LPDVETGVDLGQKASPFKKLTIDSKEIVLEPFAKDKVTLLVFGATCVLHAGIQG